MGNEDPTNSGPTLNNKDLTEAYGQERPVALENLSSLTDKEKETLISGCNTISELVNIIKQIGKIPSTTREGHYHGAGTVSSWVEEFYNLMVKGKQPVDRSLIGIGNLPKAYGISKKCYELIERDKQ